MPWRLQYLRHRPRVKEVPTLWLAAWGSLLTVMTSFLLVSAEFTQLAQFSVPVVTEADTSLRPLAVSVRECP